MKFYTHPFSRKGIYFLLVVAVAAISFSLYSITSHVLQGGGLFDRELFSQWIHIPMYTLILVQFSYMMKIASPYVEFKPDGIEYKNPMQKTVVFLPKSTIQTTRISGTTLAIQTEEKTHEIPLGMLKYNEIEQVRQAMNR